MQVQREVPPTRRVVIPSVGVLPRNKRLYCICGASCQETTKERKRFFARHDSHGAIADQPFEGVTA